MIYKNLELHGIHEVVNIRDREVWTRFPQALNDTIGHNTAYQMVGGEIRLVPEGDCFITIGTLDSWAQPKCIVFYGDYAQTIEVSFNKDITIDVSAQKVFRHQNADIPFVLSKPAGFKNNVVRVMILGESVHIKKISGSYRAPNVDEIPNKKLLTYGTSITQGLHSLSPELSYPHQLARRLGYDVYNYGLSGHAFCEKEVCDYLASQHKYDAIVLELSVNMLNSGYSVLEFEKRVTYLISTLRDKNSEIPIFCLGILPFYLDYGITNTNETYNATPNEYRKSLEKIVMECKDDNIYYVDPFKTLSIENLSSDFIHPSTLGMIEIAEKLYLEMKNKVR